MVAAGEVRDPRMDKTHVPTSVGSNTGAGAGAVTGGGQQEVGEPEGGEQDGDGAGEGVRSERDVGAGMGDEKEEMVVEEGREEGGEGGEGSEGSEGGEGGEGDVTRATQDSVPETVESDDDIPIMKGVSYPGDEWIPRWDVD